MYCLSVCHTGDVQILFERNGGDRDGIQKPNKSILLPICDAPVQHDRTDLGTRNRMSGRNNSSRRGIRPDGTTIVMPVSFEIRGPRRDSSLRGAGTRSTRPITNLSLTLFSRRRHVDLATGSVTGITNT